MHWMKRIFLFFLINILVVMTLSTILSLLGVHSYLNAQGLDIRALAIFCFVWGIGGAFISLSLSRYMAKKLMRVQIISPGGEMHELYEKVERLSERQGLECTPEVGMFDSPTLNAFATGPSQKRSLVAVSTGLLSRMNEDELEGVLAHEISHIANGDMVTMTLLQGVLNAFVMFLARIMAYLFTSRGRKQSSYLSFHLFTFLFESVFMIVGYLVIALFSRRREFRADEGGAALAGTDKMIAALESLKDETTVSRGVQKEQAAFHALMISETKKKKIARLFSTHPPLETRIARLRNTHATEALIRS